MVGPATHFAPRPGRLSSGALRGPITLVSVTALSGVSGFVRDAFGDKVLRHANTAAMLDIEAIEDENCFIPHLVMTRFATSVAKSAREEHFGLIVAPHLTMASKGIWGGYMLGAPTLGEAIRRGIETIRFHSKGDVMSLGVRDGEARISYFSASKGQDGYAHAAAGTVGILINLCRAYLPVNWRPLRVELDIPRPPIAALYEDVFACPVAFDAPSISVWLAADQLGVQPLRRPDRRLITVGDLARARFDLQNVHRLRDIVEQQIWAQVLTGTVSIDSAARSLDTSVRTLQRELNREGTSFRDVTNAMRARRAAELLHETAESVTGIATLLGYASPAHFARAFRNATGMSPQEFRRRPPSTPGKIGVGM